jgi:xyloglucan-specific exo-beta-1,4-glucanase
VRSLDKTPFLLSLTTIIALFILPACNQNSVIADKSQTIPSPLLVQAKAPPNVPKAKSPKNKNLFNWRNVNIQGMGYVTGLITSPVAPYDVYVRTDVGGIYRFNRANNSWIPLMDMFDTNFAIGGVGVESLALDAVKPNRVYVAIKSKNSDFKDKDNKVKSKYAGEVLVSENKGISWKSTGLGKHNIYVGPNEAYRAETGERLAVDPHQSGLVYFASRRHGLWRKKGNADWVRVTK